MRWFPFEIYKVEGESMLPTLVPGQRVIINKWSKGAKGDLIVFYAQGRTMIKRISHIEKEQRYVTGDNASKSTGSEEFGKVSPQVIIGRVLG